MDQSFGPLSICIYAETDWDKRQYRLSMKSPLSLQKLTVQKVLGSIIKMSNSKTTSLMLISNGTILPESELIYPYAMKSNGRFLVCVKGAQPTLQQHQDEIKALQHTILQMREKADLLHLELENDLQFEKQNEEKWEEEKRSLDEHYNEEVNSLITKWKNERAQWENEGQHLLQELTHLNRLDDAANHHGQRQREIERSEEMAEAIKPGLEFMKQSVEELTHRVALLSEQIARINQEQADSAKLLSSSASSAFGMSRVSLQQQLDEETNAIHTQLLQLKLESVRQATTLWRERKEAVLCRVEEMKGNVRVIIRCRPLEHPDSVSKTRFLSPSSLSVETRNKVRTFHFSRVFPPTASQRDVYEEMRGLVVDSVHGTPTTIIAYGATGTGKTHTLFGDLSSLNDCGIVVRAVFDIFDLANSPAERGANRIDFSCSFVELYQNEVCDLLDSIREGDETEKVSVLHLGGKVSNIVQKCVDNAEDALELIFEGEERRVVAETRLNAHSSRSHTIFTIHMHKAHTPFSSISFVDLAGSERVAKSQSSGQRLKEAQSINKSLSALGDVVSSLSKNASFIPFRNSKLTELLQNALGGDSKTVIVVSISPNADSVSETVNSLEFGGRVRKVQNRRSSSKK
ncbi:putative Carboxy-terminal kinesin 2 [Blattamonas nauphoetae]|uniref:Kinesin-like protein n=1 Tax=Blattamonas nauphoetae TaxID=2049346 RepID=A0ABQ9Y9I2_9EUKA|nr:putative Carboxy-terminal kinesin 2 [Blattamonas nauphoetae]